MNEEATPFGAENLPFKELEKPIESNKETTALPGKKSTFIILLAVIGLLLLIILFLLILRNQTPPVQIAPSPSMVTNSPTPVATASASSKSIDERLAILEDKLKTVDLQQTEFSFPLLDFSFNLGQKR